MKSRPTKQKLKQRGILRERVFGCDLGEHLLNSGHDVPQVLKSCTEFIEKHGVVDGIYRLSGIASNIQKLRHEFDSEQIPDLTKDVYIQDIHCVGSLCKLYFRELPNPLLTYQLYEKFSDAVSAATDEERLIKIHDVIQQLPPPHYRTLEFLMRHLSRLAAFSCITNMHSKNLAIVWAPNLLRSKQIESACFSGTAAFMEVRIQSVVVEFILNHVDVLFSTKLSTLIREGGGHNSLSRPKSLLISSPSTKLLSLEEAQARTQAQINSPVTEDSKYIEVGEGPAALQGKFHTVIEFPTERKRPPIKSKKSPVGSWRSFFNLGKSSSMSKRKLHRNPSEPNELKAMALAGGRGDTATLRSAKSEESLSSLHNVEGESKVFRPRRPRSSSDALSASFNGELLDSRQHCNSYDNLDGGEDSDDGPICVPALISPPRLAGEDVDLSPPDMGVASLDFDPMSFQCSLADSNPSYAFPLDELPAGAEGLKRSPMSLGGRSGANFIPATLMEEASAESRRAANPQPCSSNQSAQSTRKAATQVDLLDAALTPEETKDAGPPLMGSVLLRAAEPTLSEAFQVELHYKLAAFDAPDSQQPKVDNSKRQQQAEQHEAVSADYSKDNTPCAVNSTVSTTGTTTTTTPPPPPPKNAARMLALALAESAQQVSCQSQPCDASTPPSPLDASALLHTTLPPVQASTPDKESGRNSPPPASTPDKSQLAPPNPANQQPVELTSIGSAKTSTVPPVVQPETDFAPHSDAPLQKSTPPPPNATSQASPTRKSPERQPSATVRDPAHTSSSDGTLATSYRDTKVSTQSAPVVKGEGLVPPVIPSRPLEQPPQKPKRQSLSLHQNPTHIQDKTPPRVATQIQLQKMPSNPAPQPLTKPAPQPLSNATQQLLSNPATQPLSNPAPLLQAQVKSPPNQTQPSQPLSKASARVAPTTTEPAEKPWEAIKPIQPCTQSKHLDPHGPAAPPPPPPVRTIESKLATAALSQSEAPYHIIPESFASSHLEETLSHHPVPSCPPASHPSAYLYHAKGEPILIEPAGTSYYHQRAQPVPHHYRPDSVPPHISFVSKSETQIPYVTRVDNRYSTLGPRSYHHSIKSRGNPRGVYMGTAPGPQGYSHDKTHGYPTIRRVHSLHVPSTIRTVPIQRTEVPPNDDIFFYHRPVHQCKAYQQQQQQSSSQGDYHVTQLQPYFENGRVQYRYSPYSDSSPADPYHDIDPYGTIRVRHLHLYSRDQSGFPNRPSGKVSGYHHHHHHHHPSHHHLARHLLPTGKEHSFVSRDMPPGHGATEPAAYLPWDPEESERLQVHSIRRESRARQKAKGPVLSQYDNIGFFAPADMSGYETLHLRSKSDPGKAVLVTAENKDARYLPRPMVSDPDVLMYMETDKHAAAEKSDGKPNGSMKCQSSHSLPSTLSHSLSLQTKYETGEDKKAGDGSRSKHLQQEYPSKRNFLPRYERPDAEHQSKGKTPSGYSAAVTEQQQQVAPREQFARSKLERSHSVREQQHYNQGKAELERDYSYQKHSTQSHYDNLDDYHPIPQLLAPVRKRGGSSSYATQGSSTTGHNNNQAYSTALGQGAFIQTDLAVPRPETEICTE